ncbi:PAS domain-containing protein [Rhizobium sp. NFACC06-2]|uniref:PAS domain-containing protein n=1 Tax=Rhizobium sp. NFACC06-2 TaxID=1566264 RepID=UPI003369E0B7
MQWIPSGQPWEIQFQIAWPDGTYRSVVSCARAHIASDGTVLRWFGVISDQTTG